jgi:hypothetical protein
VVGWRLAVADLLTFWSASMGLRGAMPRWLPVVVLLAICGLARIVLARQIQPSDT